MISLDSALQHGESVQHLLQVVRDLDCIGKTTPVLKRPTYIGHMSKKCDQVFFSEQAMKQHRDHPSHDTMFSCDTCQRQFESKQAVAQLENSPPHAAVMALKQANKQAEEQMQEQAEKEGCHRT
jgi:hypothetical protein